VRYKRRSQTALNQGSAKNVLKEDTGRNIRTDGGKSDASLHIYSTEGNPHYVRNHTTPLEDFSMPPKPTNHPTATSTALRSDRVPQSASSSLYSKPSRESLLDSVIDIRAKSSQRAAIPDTKPPRQLSERPLIPSQAPLPSDKQHRQTVIRKPVPEMATDSRSTSNPPNESRSRRRSSNSSLQMPIDNITAMYANETDQTASKVLREPRSTPVLIPPSHDPSRRPESGPVLPRPLKDTALHNPVPYPETLSDVEWNQTPTTRLEALTSSASFRKNPVSHLARMPIHLPPISSNKPLPSLPNSTGMPPKLLLHPSQQPQPQFQPRAPPLLAPTQRTAHTTRALTDWQNSTFEPSRPAPQPPQSSSRMSLNTLSTLPSRQEPCVTCGRSSPSEEQNLEKAKYRTSVAVKNAWEFANKRL
jgi:hypothetical protein